MLSRKLTILFLFFFSVGTYSKVPMKEVRKLVKMPVDKILSDRPIKKVLVNKYWQSIKTKRKPVIVFFYANKDDESKRVASLLYFLSSEFKERIDFASVEVSKDQKPNTLEQKSLKKKFSLEHTPGILFYDNVGSELVLEDEDYIEADFKEFRSPSLVMWKIYYRAVKKELEKLLTD